MDEATVLALMTEQVNKVRDSALSNVFGWTITVDVLTVFITVKPRKRNDRSFLLRAQFDDFPRRAPSCVFVNPQTRAPDDAAWPPGVRHGAAPPGICTPGTREFHEHYHKNDHQHLWDSTRLHFLHTLTEIHRLVERGIGN